MSTPCNNNDDKTKTVARASAHEPGEVLFVFLEPQQPAARLFEAAENRLRQEISVGELPVLQGCLPAR
jgi:hypothetical protein